MTHQGRLDSKFDETICVFDEVSSVKMWSLASSFFVFVLSHLHKLLLVYFVVFCYCNNKTEQQSFVIWAQAEKKKIKKISTNFVGPCWPNNRMQSLVFFFHHGQK